MASTSRAATFTLQPAPYNASRDVAECLDFARPFAGGRLRFDLRSERDLRAAAFDEPSALERERALWELADRLMADSAADVDAFLRTETDAAARRHAVWLLFQVLGRAATERLETLRHDGDPEVADWARVLLTDIDGQPRPGVYREAQVVETGPFDQTLPLVISGHVLVAMPGLDQVVARLSPQWFEAIMGRVMACTNQATFMTDLVIEKATRGMHRDGSDHFEIYRFRGMSAPLSDHQFEHHYLSLTTRPFYPSGRVEEGPYVRCPIEMDRVANTTTAVPGDYRLVGDGERARRLADSPVPFVDNVRGRYHGWAAVHLPSVLEHGTVRARDVQLANPTDAVAGPLTNARLYGTFRGKVADHDGGGRVGVNTVPCHGTTDGEHDLHCDGSLAPDPFLGPEAARTGA